MKTINKLSEKPKIILSIENLKKYFVNKGRVNKAVDDVSFNVHEGEIVGLIGESGSGKTTVGRTLLRLYEDADGFVTLDGQIISGRRISKARRKQMRKNIQMIFQDPHASLNGQKTIFSILKEPLIVNHVIKDQIKDLNQDWYKIKENFRFSFLEKTKKWELENWNLIEKLLGDFYNSWSQKLQDINFEATTVPDDNFNSYFSFIEEKNSINSILINNLYTNSEDLINYYQQKQTEYRNGDLDFDEALQVKAQKEYDNALQLSKKSKELIANQKLLKEKQTLLQKIKNEEKEIVNISKNTFYNFVGEYKNEIIYQRNNSLSSFNLNFFFHSYKLQLLNTAARNLVKKVRKSLSHLSFEEIKKFNLDLSQYLKQFYDDKLNVDETKKESIALLKKTVLENFTFNTDEFVQKSNELKEIYLQKKQPFIEQINELKLKIKQGKSEQPSISLEELKQFEQNLKTANEEHQIELNKYINNYKTRIETINQNLKEAKQRVEILYTKDKEMISHFKEVQKKFEAFYKTNYVDSVYKKYLEELKSNGKNIYLAKFKNLFIKKDVSPHYSKYLQRKVQLNVYKTNFNQRFDSLKSFDIERKYINKDLHKINMLLGIDKISLSIDEKLKKYVKVAAERIFGYWALKQIDKLLIKNTIYKSLEDVGLLKQFAYRYPHEFSGGQRQRIVIARALITKPKVIVADEPIASLDISIQAQVVNLLKDLCKEKNIGMVFIAHDLSMIEYVADRVQIMHLGKIVESGDTYKIYQEAIHPYTNNLFKAIPKISNATEKFQNVSFELSYLSEQKFPNVPVVHTVEDGHYVYGTKTQFDKWMKEEHFTASGLLGKNTDV